MLCYLSRHYQLYILNSEFSLSILRLYFSSTRCCVAEKIEGMVTGKYRKKRGKLCPFCNMIRPVALS